MLSLLLVLAMPATGLPAQTSFREAARSHATPELLFDNEAALAARLRLLDAAPAGAQVSIATFTIDAGLAAAALAARVCAATSRGVRVELVADGKGGGRPGLPDTFDAGDEKQLVEELYQRMADCGARVTVHNQASRFVEVFGTRLPNVFLDPAFDGRRLSLFELPRLLRRLGEIADRTAALAAEEAAAEGLAVDLRGHARRLKSLLGAGMRLWSITARARPFELTAPDLYHDTVTELERGVRGLVGDPAWATVSPDRLRAVLARAEARAAADPELSALGREIRRFHRLSHRKLFLVEHQGEGCMLLGGRNLGDDYLTARAGSFFDGDVLLCRHHGPEAARAIAEAAATFRRLTEDTADPFLGLPADNELFRVEANASFPYRHATPSLLAQGEAAGRASRQLPGIPLPGAGGWRYLTAGWDPAADQVRSALMGAIRAERRELYLETPYAELNAGMREELEAALLRGVRVRLVTNSFFITDGFSKLIRLTNAHWLEKMQARYPALFEVGFLTYKGGRMTHFKGAAFACQPSREGKVRAFLVGSHNFDPRGGRSDKEHALTWREKEGACGPLERSPLVAGRLALFAGHAEATGHAAVTGYPDLAGELREIGALWERKNGGNRWLALALERILASPGEASRRFCELADASGLRDLLGRVL